MKAVLWDLDDTLLETLPARMRALAHAYERCVGGATDPLSLWRSHRGGSLEAMGRKLMGDDGPRFVQAYRDFYFGNSHPVRPFDGIPAVLETIRGAGITMAVVTAKISWGAIDELSSAGLLEYFGAVVGADDTEAHKPDPEPIYAAMARLCVDDPDQLLFIGDSPADMFAARNAGCGAVAAMWGTLDEELLLDTSPAYVAREPGDVLQALAAAAGVAP